MTIAKKCTSIQDLESQLSDQVTEFETFLRSLDLGVVVAVPVENLNLIFRPTKDDGWRLFIFDTSSTSSVFANERLLLNSRPETIAKAAKELGALHAALIAEHDVRATELQSATDVMDRLLNRLIPRPAVPETDADRDGVKEVDK